MHRLLKRELEALCQQRAPDDQWQWIEPPRSEAGGSCAAAGPGGGDLLTNPVDELERVEALLRNQRAAE